MSCTLKKADLGMIPINEIVNIQALMVKEINRVLSLRETL